VFWEVLEGLWKGTEGRERVVSPLGVDDVLRTKLRKGSCGSRREGDGAIGVTYGDKFRRDLGLIFLEDILY
jgi:hypothetical protein